MQQGTSALGVSDDSGSLLSNAAQIGGLTLVSRLLGLLRDVSMAWLVGGGIMADALVAAMRLPHALRRLLGEGSLSLSMTATLLRQEDAHVSNGDHAWGQTDITASALQSLAKAIALRLGLLLAALTLAGVWGAPLLTALVAPGLVGQELSLAVELFRICLPYVFTAGMAALAMAVLHCRQVFWLPAFSPVLFNLTMLAFTGVAVFCELEPAPALAWGMLVGGGVQWLVQWVGVRRFLLQDPLCQGERGQRIQAGACQQDWGRSAWRCLGHLPAGVLGAAAPQLAMLAAMILASGLGEGKVAALFYAERLLELPLGLVGACLGMASLPSLSRLAIGGDLALFAERLSQAIRWSLLLALPAASGLWATGPYLIEVLFGHGAFELLAVRETSLALWAYLPGLPVFACNRCLLAGCNALGQIRQTAMSTLAAVGTTLAAGFVLSHSLPETGVVMAPALAVSLGGCTQTWFLSRSLVTVMHSRGQSIKLLRFTSLLRQTAAALAAGLTAWAILTGIVSGSSGIWLGLMLAVLAGMLVWLAWLYCCGREELISLQSAISAKQR